MGLGAVAACRWGRAGEGAGGLWVGAGTGPHGVRRSPAATATGAGAEEAAWGRVAARELGVGGRGLGSGGRSGGVEAVSGGGGSGGGRSR